VILVFTSFFFVFLRNIRRAIGDNLVAVLGPCGWVERQRRIWRTMWSFAWCLSERYERLATERDYTVTTDNLEAWHELSDSREGFVMVTAHIGNFEVGSMLPSLKEARRVHLVREREADPAAQEFVQKLLDRLPAAELYSWHFETTEPLQGLPLLQALRRGEIVAVQGDRPRTGARSIHAELFGRPFPFPAGPVTLARTARVAVLPVFVFRRGRRRYHVVFRSPLRVANTADRQHDLETAARRAASDIEWAIRQTPHQWFCFHRLWPDS
jgi:lauroyl/myristoyl acyltransferase